MHRIGKVRRLDHVVLFVSAQAMLRTECGNQVDVRECCDGVERVNQIPRYGCRMRQQCHAASRQRLSQRRFFQETIDAEFHGLIISDAGRAISREKLSA
jgi:hypothetical protein